LLWLFWRWGLTKDLLRLVSNCVTSWSQPPK
jgi:hypothetical protein